jgi:hypothetical protein
MTASVESEGAWKETVEGLKVALAEDLYVSTTPPSCAPTWMTWRTTMRYLISMGVRNIASTA